MEVEVEKELGFKCKRDIETYGLEKFVEKCKERVRKYAAVQTAQSVRMGYWMHWDDSYFTMTDENNYAIWGFLKKCHERGFVYKGADSMPWCPRCGTGISQNEMHEGYREVADTSVYLRLPIRGRENEYLLVWTTTPWTLAANVACAVGPDVKYARVKQDSDIYYVAAALAGVMKTKGPVEVLGELTGREMIGWTYDGPFDELEAQEQTKEHHRIIAWEDVSDTEGTGIVHIAPGCGKEDFDLSGVEKLPVLAPIDDSGIYFDGYGFLSGRYAGDVADEVLESLRAKRVYYMKEKYTHSYPHCWRCGTALLFRHVHEWFINMSWRDEIKENVKKIRWIPDWGEARELDWLDNMRNWMISKKRFWGLALPIYECECGWFDVVGSKEELKERAVEGWDAFEGNSPHRPWVDAVKIQCPECGGAVSRIKDVGNPWLDAGIVPYSTVGYYRDREYWKQWIPADLVLECFPGQFRNWFYALLAMSTMMENIPPFKTLFGYALVRDENGEEMHKSAGNAIWFEDAAEKMGVDIMRWLFCKQNPVNNLNFGYGAGKEVERKVFGTWWNVYAFFCNYARLDNFDVTAPQVPVADRPHMDRWILSNLNLLAARADEALEKYDAAAVVRAAEQFVEGLSNWYVRRNRRRFWRARSHADTDKLAAYQTLYEVLVKLSQILAPLVPFVSEVMYRNLVASQDEAAPESVHLCRFPQADDALIDNELSTDMDAAADFVSRVLSLRKARQIRVRQPLPVVTAACADDWRTKALQRFEDHVLDELNVKELAFAKDVADLAGCTVKPNFASIGPKFGGAAKAVAGALAAADPADVAGKVAAGQSVSVAADGETYELAPDDILVERTCPDNIALHESSEMTVALDTALSDELVAEGMVRDLVRHVQTLRKERDLEMDDRITLGYAADDASVKNAIAGWTAYIRSETLADELTDTVSGEPDKTVKINGVDISLKLSRL